MPAWYEGAMRLADYLAQKGLTQAVFARKIGVSQGSVARYLKGERRPNWAVLQRIQKVTGGAVRPEDFFDAPRKRRAA